MPQNIRCQSCGSIVFGFKSEGPKPLGTDECPECGGTEFEFLK